MSKERKITWNTRSRETLEWMCLESASVAWGSGMRISGFTDEEKWVLSTTYVDPMMVPQARATTGNLVPSA